MLGGTQTTDDATRLPESDITRYTKSIHLENDQ